MSAPKAKSLYSNLQVQHMKLEPERLDGKLELWVLGRRDVGRC